MTFTQGATNNTNYPINFVEDGANRLTITSGNVGIGTTSPQYTLDVIGDIRVTGSVWYGGTSGSANGTLYTKPDYVFSPGYKVMTVDAVESYLLKENHLPWMTPLKSEKKGAIDMTRMGFETVETAENLQLQIIFLNKKLKQQQKEIGAQKNRIGALNEKVDALEKDIKEIKKESH